MRGRSRQADRPGPPIRAVMKMPYSEGGGAGASEGRDCQWYPRESDDSLTAEAQSYPALLPRAHRLD